MEVKMDDLGTRSLLKRIIYGARDMTPAMKAIGEYMIRRTQERFSREEDPEGKRWKKHSPITLPLAWRRKGKRTYTKSGKVTKGFSRYVAARKILTASHQLRMSITYKESPDKVVVGTNKVYAAIHQFGGKAGRGRKVNIPARPVLGINDDDRAEAVRILKEYMGFKG